MLLKQIDVDRLWDLVERGEAVPSIPFAGCADIATALDLACVAATWDQRAEKRDAASAIARWARSDERLGAAVRAFAGHRDTIERWSAPLEEFAPLGARNSLDDQAAGFFHRFTSSLDRHGRFSTLSRAISTAMMEMADNAIQHSGADEHHPAPGAMGYAVSKGAAVFSVVDGGRGVLASLSTNPTWAKLDTTKEALEAAIMHAASRRAGQGAGRGFSDLHKALADLSGKLRFASGDAVLKLEGERDARVVAWASRPISAGFQLSVSIKIVVSD